MPISKLFTVTRLLRHSASLALAAITLLSSSCAFNPELNETELAAARTFTPPKGQALLCVYRPSTVLAMLTPRPVFINGQHLSSNTNGSFMTIPLKPGKYTVQASAQALIDTPKYKAAYPDLHFSLKAGQTVFIRQTVNFIVGDPSVTMLQTGGTPVPMVLGNDLPAFKATVVNATTARSEISGLKHVGADPLEENPQ